MRTCEPRTLLTRLSNCDLCPRCCHVDRTSGNTGICRTGARARVDSAFPHFGEERVLSGTRGSGTVFFSGCNLRCVFCQNHGISHGGDGREVTNGELADLLTGLEAAGCHNVNLVTPSHVVPQVCAALERARTRGLEIPVVYNTSAYDRVDTLRCLDGLVDIYMPDFKFWSPEPCTAFLDAGDYPEVASAAITEMHRQVGDLEVDSSGIARRGLLVRHLVMPGRIGDTAEIMGFLAALSRDTFVNLMSQYRPFGGAEDDPDLARRPRHDEMEASRRAAVDAGLHRFPH